MLFKKQCVHIVFRAHFRIHAGCRQLLANQVLPACAVLVLERLRKAAKVGERGGRRGGKWKVGKKECFGRKFKPIDLREVVSINDQEDEMMFWSEIRRHFRWTIN